MPCEVNAWACWGVLGCLGFTESTGVILRSHLNWTGAIINTDIIWTKSRYLSVCILTNKETGFKTWKTANSRGDWWEMQSKNTEPQHITTTEVTDLISYMKRWINGSVCAVECNRSFNQKHSIFTSWICMMLLALKHAMRRQRRSKERKHFKEGLNSHRWVNTPSWKTTSRVLMLWSYGESYIRLK